MDRFDMHVEMPRVPFEATRRLAGRGETARVAASVASARAAQLRRGATLNAHLRHRALIELAAVDTAASILLSRTAERWKLSARSCDRVLKVSRTIADLASERVVGAAHVAEAIQLRCLDRPL